MADVLKVALSHLTQQASPELAVVDGHLPRASHQTGPPAIMLKTTTNCRVIKLKVFKRKARHRYSGIPRSPQGRKDYI